MYDDQYCRQGAVCALHRGQRRLRALGYATGFVTPLDDKGEQVWPKAGDEASFNLLPASCSAEAVARLPACNAVFHKGRLAYGSIAKAG